MKNFPFNPGLSCIKNIGEPRFIFTTKKIMKNNGIVSGKLNKMKIKSIGLLKKLHRFYF